MSKNSVESKIIINAPIERVWKVLTDFEQYKNWNPFTPKIEIEKVLGSTVGLHVRLNPKSSKTMYQKETLLLWDDYNKRLEWGIEDAWYVQTVRVQQLTKLGLNQTEYYTIDLFEGPLTWLILKLYRQKIQIGFDDVGKGLKDYIERA